MTSASSFSKLSKAIGSKKQSNKFVKIQSGMSIEWKADRKNMNHYVRKFEENLQVVSGFHTFNLYKYYKLISFKAKCILV